MSVLYYSEIYKEIITEAVAQVSKRYEAFIKITGVYSTIMDKPY